MTTSVPQIDPQSPSAESVDVKYVKKSGLGWLSIKNFLLTVLTLGIYRFWAKTNVRRHVWSCIHVNDEPLEYTGTGTELFLGALVIFFVIFLPYILLVLGLQVMFGPNSAPAIIIQFLFLILVFMLYGMAIYRARRYRLSRTLWRGIRGTLTGSSIKYSLLYFGSMLLSGITLGWSNPAMSYELQKRITDEMKFGETPFTFKGNSGALYPPYAICWFSSLFALMVLIGFAVGGIDSPWGAGLKSAFTSSNQPDESTIVLLVLAIYGGLAILALVFAVIWTFYNARMMKAFADFTAFDNAQFNLNATTMSLFWLWFGNLLIIVFSLGIATPFAVQRMIKYMCDRLHVSGWVDFGTISQSTAPMDKRGEGLLDAFDIDAF